MTTINVEAKKSKNYQTYTVGVTVDVEHATGEELEVLIKAYQRMCTRLAQMQIDNDENNTRR